MITKEVWGWLGGILISTMFAVIWVTHIENNKYQVICCVINKKLKLFLS